MFRDPNLVLNSLMIVAIAAVVLLLSLALAADRQPERLILPDGFSVLVGQGCEGPDPIAVAVEEDLLPICERIDVHQVALGDAAEFQRP